MDDSGRLSGETLVVVDTEDTQNSPPEISDRVLTPPIIVFQENQSSTPMPGIVLQDTQSAVLTPGVPFQENRAAIIAIAASLGFFIFILIVWITLAAIPHKSDVTVRFPTY